MVTILKTTQLSQMVHHLCNGEQVVRNTRIFALIKSQLTTIPLEHRMLLAKPTFIGTSSNESIRWTTEAFTSEPVPLSELTGDERKHYLDIYAKVVDHYRLALAMVSADTKELLKQALTCHSEANIFCADDKVVVTEWGMTPSGRKASGGLLSFELLTGEKPGGTSATSRRDTMSSPLPETHNTASQSIAENIGRGETVYGGPNNMEEARQKMQERQQQETQKEVQNAMPNSVNTSNPVPPVGQVGANHGFTGHTDNTGGTGAVGMNGGGGGTTNDGTSGKQKRGWWKWLIPLLLLLLAALIIFLCLKSCGGESMSTIPSVTSPISKQHVVVSDDSLTMQVDNRVIVLIMSGGTVNDFIRDFRQQYPDKEKYLIENPDTIIPRVVVTLPDKKEKEDFVNSIGVKFKQYELKVIPETLFSTTALTNDPALNDPDKRWYFDMCGIDEAWEETMGDTSIVVAVIDDGFDLNHEELKGKVVKPYNAVLHNDKITPSESGHGTHTASTAVGNANNGKGTSGIAPGCKLMPIQVGDENGLMPTSAIIDGLLYAIIQDADVVNVSLESLCLNPAITEMPIFMQKHIIENYFKDEEDLFEQIFDMAEEKNVTFVLSGGNMNVLVGFDPMKRSSKTIKVAAVQPDKYKADFSNFGPNSTLSAPGVEIFNAVPGNQYEVMDGTSMASPIVAGAVALLKSKDKSLTTQKIIDILRTTGLRSPSDVGPIVHFGNALKGRVQTPADDPNVGSAGAPKSCDEIALRYQQLLKELEQLRRDYPGCCEDPDTMSIPVGVTYQDLNGIWKSTTPLYNDKEQEVVLYFKFNGTQTCQVLLVEPDGTRFTSEAPIQIDNDVIYIDQTTGATNGQRGYNPYRFVFRPDRNRRAVCRGQNKMSAVNHVDFNLIQINN